MTWQRAIFASDPPADWKPKAGEEVLVPNGTGKIQRQVGPYFVVDGKKRLILERHEMRPFPNREQMRELRRRHGLRSAYSAWDERGVRALYYAANVTGRNRTFIRNVVKRDTVSADQRERIWNLVRQYITNDELREHAEAELSEHADT